MIIKILYLKLTIFGWFILTAVIVDNSAYLLFADSVKLNIAFTILKLTESEIKNAKSLLQRYNLNKFQITIFKKS